MGIVRGRGPVARIAFRLKVRRIRKAIQRVGEQHMMTEEDALALYRKHFPVAGFGQPGSWERD